MTRGIPGSGKSAWAKTMVETPDSKWKRINKDDLRSMLNAGTYSSKHEKGVLVARNAMIRAFLEDGYSVIVDDTNIQSIHIQSVYHVISQEFPHVEFEVMDFDVSLRDCIARDALRTVGHVGKDVIYRMYGQYTSIDKLEWMNMVIPSIEHHVNEPHLPSVIIVDIDGTVADRVDRNPFEWNKVGNDLPKKDILFILEQAALDPNTTLVFMSGRDGSCYDETKLWLKQNLSETAYNTCTLFMRANNDMRKDYIVKRELYETHIRGKYNVLAVFDDRDQVVHMWRKQLGLTCLQVNYGKF